MASDTGVEVEGRAINELADLHWQVESLERHDFFNDESGIDSSDFLEGYRKAMEGEIVVVHQLDKQPMSLKGGWEVDSPERVTELHIDEIIINAGGRRIVESDVGGFQNKNADYLLGDIVFELKDLQKEGLDVPTRQDKIYDLFEPYLPQDAVVDISKIQLPNDVFREYCNIIGKPIQKRIGDANKQVKATLAKMNNPNLSGGVLILNSGYWSIDHQLLIDLDNRYIGKDFSAIQHVVIMSTYLTSDGYNQLAQFAFHPKKSDIDVLDKLGNCFMGKVMQFMKPSLMHLVPKEKQQKPRQLFTFERNGRVLTIPAPLPDPAES